MFLVRKAATTAAVSFTPFATEYTTAGNQIVAIPVGATAVSIECIGAGAGGGSDSATWVAGGGGGAYSKKLNYSTSGLTGLYISVPAASTTAGAAAFVKANSSSGTLICEAKGGLQGAKTYPYGQGGQSSDGTGDVKYSGGKGGVTLTFSSNVGGGGAAGPSGNGGNGSSSGLPVGGSSGGSPAGKGGDHASGYNGVIYGGGAGSNSSSFIGAKGYIKLSWS